MNLTYILVATAFLLTACNNTKEENKEEKKEDKPAMMMMNPFETVAIAKSNPQVMLQLAGELKPDQKTELFAKVNSYVKELRVDIGDYVTKGQVLVLLEAPELQAQLANAKGKVEAQRATYIATAATYDRMMKANETEGAIAKDAIDQITARKLADEAQLQAAEATYREVKDMDAYLVIRAPFSGMVTDRQVDLGAYVGPMIKTPLLVLEDNDKLRLNLSIPEANASYLNMGDTISFQVRSQPQTVFKAQVSRKTGSMDVQLRSERIEADVLNADKTLKPYMIAEAKIPLQHTEATFFVPKMAVVESGMGVYVIRVEQGKTKNVPVRKGRVMPEQFEVFGELNEGDMLLKMASEEVMEGTEIPKAKM